MTLSRNSSSRITKAVTRPTTVPRFNRPPRYYSWSSLFDKIGALTAANRTVPSTMGITRFG